MALKVIKEGEHGYPVGAYLRVEPLFNSTYDIVLYEVYESESTRTAFKQDKFNPKFRKIENSNAQIGEVLNNRIKNEIPANTTSIYDAIATVFYQELRKLDKFTTEYFENC